MFYYFKFKKEMKKIVLALAVVFSVALVSCGNKKAEAVDSDTVVAVVEEVVEDTVADSATGDSAVVEEVAGEAAAAVVPAAE